MHVSSGVVGNFMGPENSGFRGPICSRWDLASLFLQNVMLQIKILKKKKFLRGSYNKF